MEVTGGRRLLARGAAAFAALNFASVAIAFRSFGAMTVMDVSFGGGGAAQTAQMAGVFVGLVLVPLALAAVLGWWSFTGWRERPPRPLVGAALWGTAAVYLWGIGGLLVSAAWQRAVGGEVANTVGLYPMLTLPLGLLAGAVFGYWRSARGRPR